MARRKAWFRVADSVLHDNFSNDQLAVWVRLLAAMNSRWARHGLTADEAGTIELSSREVALITGRFRRDVGEKSLRSLGDICGISVEREGELLRLSVPKFSDFQGLRSPKFIRNEPPTVDTPPPPPPPPPTPPISKSSDAAKRLAEGMRLSLEGKAERDGRKLRRHSPDVWARDMDKLLRVDGIAADEIARVICWAVDDSFWGGVIASPAGLRRNWDKVSVQVARSVAVADPFDAARQVLAESEEKDGRSREGAQARLTH